MSMTINPGQQLELRDQTGGMVGLVVNAETLRALIADRDALQQQVADLQKQLGQALKERAKIEAERDDYVQAMEVLSREGLVPVGEDEIKDMRQNGLSFEEVLREVDAVLAAKQPEAK